jgi:hypothetical protein
MLHRNIFRASKLGDHPIAPGTIFHCGAHIMRKTVYILAAAAAALTSTIGMAKEAKQSFEYEGSTYVYTSSVENGRQVINGRRFPSGQAFHLIVRGDRVSGTAGGVPVAFATTEASGAAGGIAAVAR